MQKAPTGLPQPGDALVFMNQVQDQVHTCPLNGTHTQTSQGLVLPPVFAAGARQVTDLLLNLRRPWKC